MTTSHPIPNNDHHAVTTHQQYQALLTAASQTAGSNTWKTYSGRLDGPDEFIYSDVWRCVKNSMRRKFVKSHVVKKKKRGDVVCPVCLEDPMNDDENDNVGRGIDEGEDDSSSTTMNGWYVTKSCNHAVCRECLQSYANSLIADPNHSGPLKCPCCPRLLRPEDAKVALSNPLLDRNGKKRGGSGRNTITNTNVNTNVNFVGGAPSPRLETISELSSSTKRSSSFRKLSKRELFANNSKHDDDTEDDEIQIERNALDVLEKWDKKVRDEFLRAMPDFRPCPHCANNSGDSKNNTSQSDGVLGSEQSPNNQNSRGNNSQHNLGDGGGGGFVTPECLAPINDLREQNATRFIDWAGTPTAKSVVFAYFLYYGCCTHCLSNNDHNNNNNDRNHNHHNTQSNNIDSERFQTILQILIAIIPMFLLPILPHIIRLLLAKLARRQLTSPILVTCPCCNLDFHLDASSELQSADPSSTTSITTATAISTAEFASQQWKNEHTRPCPSCSSPILKDGGCNHVKCGKCRVDFCWACMRTRTSCKAFQCRNGAPYGNASGDGSFMAISEGLMTMVGEGGGRTLMERIDHVEMMARRNLSMGRYRRVQTADYFMSLVLIYIGGNLIMWLLSLFSLKILAVLSSLLVIHAMNRGRRRMERSSQVVGNDAARTDREDDFMRRVIETFQQANSNRNGRNRRGRSFLEGIRQRSARMGFRTEEEMVAETMARSLLEQ